MRNKWVAFTALSLALVQLAVILVSWIASAALPFSNVRSLLGSEGIRWFFGHFTDNLLSPLLVWLLVLSIAFGALQSSGLLSAVRNVHALNMREKFALRFVLVELLLSVLVMVLLSALPHAVLLSVTGSLFPGSFSNSLIPYLAFTLCTLGVSYGMLAGRLKSITDVLQTLSRGLSAAAPLFLIYIFGRQLYCSLLFVFTL